MALSDKYPKSLCIVGSTASGKSALALSAAQKYGGEIISVDSMQVYRTMDIGTAKPTAAEMQAVKHHMIDVCDPHDSFSSAEYAEMALKCVEDISKRGKLPIFCGGTGLYLESVMRGCAPHETSADENVRRELLEYAKENGNAALHKRLSEVDAQSAQAIHENNVKRVARALEVYLVSGKTKSEWDRESREAPSEIEPFCVCLAYHDRSVLYSRIDKRVDEMIAGGLVDETRRLYENGVFEKNSTAAGAIGYKELLGAIKGTVSLEEAAEMLKMATRRYAKRQITWFNAKPYVNFLYCDSEDGVMRPYDDIFAELCRMWEEYKNK